MSDIPRALLTPGERDAVRGDEDMTGSVRRTHFRRIKKKTEKLRKDLKLLRAYQPELAENLRQIVCEEDLDESELPDAEERTIAERLAEVEHKIDRVEEELGVDLDVDRDDGQEAGEKGDDEGGT